MGKLTNLNPSKALTEEDMPSTMATDAETTGAINAHLAAADPHLQYPTQARGDARYFRKYAQSFKVANNSSQTLTTGTGNKILFPSISSNVGSQFANSRLTALETEVWQISTYITLEMTGRIVLYLAKNGVLFKKLADQLANNGFSAQTITPLPVAPLVAGDFLEIYALAFATNSKVYGDTNLDSSLWEGYRVG